MEGLTRLTQRLVLRVRKALQNLTQTIPACPKAQWCDIRGGTRTEVLLRAVAVCAPGGVSPCWHRWFEDQEDHRGTLQTVPYKALVWPGSGADKCSVWWHRWIMLNISACTFHGTLMIQDFGVEAKSYQILRGSYGLKIWDVHKYRQDISIDLTNTWIALDSHSAYMLTYITLW